MSDDQARKALVVDEARRAAADTIGCVAAVTCQVEPQLPVGGLVGAVRLPNQRLQTAVRHDLFKMVDQPFNAEVDFAFPREGFLLVRQDVHGALWDLVHQLQDDLCRFTHLRQADLVACVAVPALGDRHLEMDRRSSLAIPVLRVAEVGFILAQIPPHSTGPGERAG